MIIMPLFGNVLYESGQAGLAEVLTRSAARSTFMETFPYVASVTYEAYRFGASVPETVRLLAGSPVGAAQGLESPSCGKTIICGRTRLPLLRPPGVLGVSATGRYLTVAR